jgi:hypothetical protein
MNEVRDWPGDGEQRPPRRVVGEQPSGRDVSIWCHADGRLPGCQNDHMPRPGSSPTTDDQAAWLRLQTADNHAQLRAEWRSLLDSLRSRLDVLRPPRLVSSESWAVMFRSSLVVVLPLHGTKHVSFQVIADDGGIRGDWQDACYAWDYEPRHSAFSLPWAASRGSTVGEAVTRTEGELRRPLRQHRFRRFGVPLWTYVGHSDGGPGWRSTAGPSASGKLVGYFEPL